MAALRALHPLHALPEEPGRIVALYGPPAVLGVLLLSVLGALSLVASREDEQRLGREAEEDAHIIARNLSLRLEGTEDLLGVLAAHLGRGQLDQAAFTRMVQGHVDGHAEVRAIQWLDVDDVVRWSTPASPGYGGVGLPLTLQSPLAAVQSARKRGHASWSTPHSPAGGLQVDVFWPVEAGGAPLGTLGGHVDVRRLFEVAVPPQLAESYRVSLLDEDGLTWNVVGEGEGEVSAAAEAELELGGGVGRVRLVPYRDASNPAGMALSLLGVGLTVAMTFVLGSYGRALRRQERARAALAASERRVADLVRSSGDAIFTLGPAGRISDVNPVFERVTGWRREEWIGRDLHEFVHADDVAVLAARLAELPRASGLCEVRVPTRDGALRVLELSIDPRDDGSAAGGAVAVARDVTVRKEFEARLTRELHHSTVLGDLARDLAGSVPPAEAAARVRQAAVELTRSRSGLPTRLDLQRGRLVLADPDGAEPPDAWGPLLTWVRERRQPLVASAPDAGGDLGRHLCVPALYGDELVGAVCVCGADRDYTDDDVLRVRRVAALYATYLERSRARRALLASEQRWRQILDQVADPIYVHDLDGHIQEVNARACAILGYTPAELARMTVFDLDTHATPAEARAAWDGIRPGTTLSLRGQHRRKDGGHVPVEVNIGRAGVDGQLRVAVARDITAHLRTEELLGVIARGLSTTGEGFFRNLVQLLSGLLPVADWVLVGQVLPDGERLRTIAMAQRGQILPDLVYDVKDTPCELTLRDGRHVCPDQACQRFPADPPLQEMGAASYIGIALHDESGKKLGVLAVLSTRPLVDPQLSVSILEIFAARAATELERIRAEAAVRRERSFLQQVIDGVPESILVVAPDHRVLLMNDTARALAPRTDAEGTLTCHQLSHGRGTPCVDGGCPLEEAVRSRRPSTVLHRQTDARGELRFVEVEATPLLDPDGALVGVIETRRDVTDRKRTEDDLREQSRRLSFQATHDRLTGLANRTLLLDRLNEALAKARRVDHRVAVLFVDLDRFKPINDRFGHETGDAMLQVLGRRLRQAVREGDTVARIGGDEFVVVLEGLADASSAANVARKVIDTLSVPVEHGGHELQVGASIGIAVFPTDGADDELLLRAADLAMYEAKLEGGRGFRYHAAQDENDPAAPALAAGIGGALDRDELRLLFQPILDLPSGRIVGAEALVRWHHPVHGVLLPDQFLALAARGGVAPRLGQWILDRALDAMADWTRDGVGPARVTLNLSDAELRDPSLADRVLGALRSRGLRAGSLAVEIAEADLVASDGRARAILDHLADAGVELLLDACGTGAASVETLRRYPLLALKIDRAFLRGLGDDPEDAAVVHGLVRRAHELGIEAVGVGVEREAQRAFLLAAGCLWGQGYLLGEPMGVERMSAALRAR